MRGQGVRILVIDTGMRPRGAPTDGAAPNRHGLAVRSLIQAPQNADGIEGIAPAARLDLVDVQDPHSIPIDLLLDAMRRGIEDGVDIISISLGTNDAYAPLQALVDEAAEKGILVFAAAGNSSARQYEYPSACARAISVASVNAAGQLSAFNTQNDAVAVFAPGESVRLPTGPNGELQTYNGTSFATPFAAGLAALILSALRIERGDKTARLSRREMIDRLRDPAHLNLNCTTHTYVMERTCTEFKDAESTSASTRGALFIGMGILILILVSFAVFLSSINSA